jgi:hypothetical protein
MAIKIEVSKVGITSKGDELKTYVQPVRTKSIKGIPCVLLACPASLTSILRGSSSPERGRYGVAAVLSISGTPDLM